MGSIYGFGAVCGCLALSVVAGLTNTRSVNWCSLAGDPLEVFPADEHCFTFDETKVNWPLLLVMSGCYPSYRDAYKAGHRGLIDYGWLTVEEGGVVVTIWNPDPGWEYDHPLDNYNIMC